MNDNIAAMTGAWSFSGRRIAQRLLANGWTLRSITSRSRVPRTIRTTHRSDGSATHTTSTA